MLKILLKPNTVLRPIYSTILFSTTLYLSIPTILSLSLTFIIDGINGNFIIDVSSVLFFTSLVTPAAAPSAVKMYHVTTIVSILHSSFRGKSLLNNLLNNSV